MRTRRSNYPNNSNVTIPRRRRKQVSNIVGPEIQTIVEIAERTMEELLRAPTEGYGEAIVLPEINADHFEIKTDLLQLNFKRWQQKMFFHLGTLNLAWFLNETAPQLRMERLNLGNSPTANIKGKGDVIHIWKRV
ncbi:hypothetical protein Tco_0045652 [Tanacetum coccineum]